MVGGGRAKDHQIGFCRHAGSDIAENPAGGQVEIGDGLLHARGVAVADAGDLGLGVVMHLAQQIAHMHVIKVDADDAELGGHSGLLREKGEPDRKQRCGQGRSRQ